MLDADLKAQLKSIFSVLEGSYTLVADVAASHPSRQELTDILKEVADCSPQINFEEIAGNSFNMYIRKADGTKSPFVFRAVPTGHEFSSLVLGILNFDGKGKNIPDDAFQSKIKALKGEHLLRSFISLTCTNCPEVVQALNLISIINPNIHHEIVDGALFTAEAEALNVQGVPSVYRGDELIHVGKASLGTLLEKLEETFGAEIVETDPIIHKHDVLVIGAGPAGATSAIYSARKGLDVAIVADRVGGQTKDTVGIENLIGTPYITGTELSAKLAKHVSEYPIKLMENRRVVSLTSTEDGYLALLQSGERVSAPAVIVATGAGWRRLNVPGEELYIGKGVAFCPHCDGPFYKGKEVAVIGGGNSGIEAAIDLSGICSKVTVVEFMDSLKADKVLQEAAAKRDNIEIITFNQVIEVVGDGKHVTGLKVKDRGTEQENIIPLSAIFVQIGLSPNSAPFKELVEVNRGNEIVIDERCRTNAPGIYAAGDVSTVPYKQIIIAMGEGAKAALSAFEDRISGKLEKNI